MGCSESKPSQSGIINNTVSPDVGSAVSGKSNSIAVEEAISPEASAASCSNNQSSAVSHEHAHQVDATGLLFRDQVTKKPSSSLITRVKKGDIEGVKDIIDKNKDTYDSLGMWSSTPLLVACQYNQRDIALYLLQHPKCNPSYVNHINEKEATALLFCCLEIEMVPVVQKLLEMGAVNNINKASSVYCNKYDKNISLCCLSAALITGNLEITKMLLQNPNDAVNNINEFHFVMSFGKGLLVVPGVPSSNVNANATTQDLKDSKSVRVNSSATSLNPIMLACVYGQFSTMEYLLNFIVVSGDMNALEHRDSNNCSVIHHICKSVCNNEDIIRSMLIKIASVLAPDQLINLIQAVDCEGNSALHYGCDNKYSTVIALLLEYGSDVDCRNKDGVTPLYIAAKKRNEDCISTLLDNNANPLLGDYSTPSVSPMQLGKKLRPDSKIFRMFDAIATKWETKPNATDDDGSSVGVDPETLLQEGQEVVAPDAILAVSTSKVTTPGSPPGSSPMRSRGSSQKLMEKAAVEATIAVSALVPVPPMNKPSQNRTNKSHREISGHNPTSTESKHASTGRKIVLPPVVVLTPSSASNSNIISPPNTTREIVMDFSPVPDTITSNASVTKTPSKILHTDLIDAEDHDSLPLPIKDVSKKLSYMRGTSDTSDLVLQDL